MKILSLMASLLGALTGALSAQAASSTQTREVPLEGGRKVVITTRTLSASAPWLVYVPGSGDELNKIGKFEPQRILSAHRSFNVLIINKVGVAMDGKVPVKDAFQRGSIRSQRIRDNVAVMKNIVPTSARILLVGLSEGAYIAPEIAENDPRVKTMILLSGNSWSWLEEEVNWVAPEKRAELRRFLETEVIPHPVFDKFYNDWSYAYFASYHTDATYRSLKASRVPILALNGDKDDVLWLEGAIQNLRRLREVEKKTNIEAHLIRGANHVLRCPDKSEDCDQDALSKVVARYLTEFLDRSF